MYTLIYYSHGPQQGCFFNANTPKTKAGIRKVPMLDFVRDAFIEERETQRELGLKCKVSIDGYADVTKDLRRDEFAQLEDFFKKKCETSDPQAS